MKPYWNRRTTFFDSEFDAYAAQVEREEADARMSCIGGPCYQGRADCPIPEACELSENDAAALDFGHIVVARISVAILIGLLVALIVGWI